MFHIPAEPHAGWCQSLWSHSRKLAKMSFAGWGPGRAGQPAHGHFPETPSTRVSLKTFREREEGNKFKQVFPSARCLVAFVKVCMTLYLKLSVLTMQTPISLDMGALIELELMVSAHVDGGWSQGPSCLHFPCAGMAITLGLLTGITSPRFYVSWLICMKQILKRFIYLTPVSPPGRKYDLWKTVLVGSWLSP